TGNGAFFRDLGEAVERKKKPPVDALRLWLIKRFLMEQYSLDGGPVAKGYENITVESEPVTLSELHNETIVDGLRIDERQLRRACKELGIELAPAKRGRPPKK